MGHTPGPWWAESGVIHAKGPKWTPDNHSCVHVPQNFDDIALMSAAPLLLAALEAVGWVDGPETAPGMGGMMEQVCPWCDKVAGDDWAHNPGCIRQAAIAAARGPGEGSGEC